MQFPLIIRFEKFESWIFCLIPLPDSYTTTYLTHLRWSFPDFSFSPKNTLHIVKEFQTLNKWRKIFYKWSKICTFHLSYYTVWSMCLEAKIFTFCDIFELTPKWHQNIIISYHRKPTEEGSCPQFVSTVYWYLSSVVISRPSDTA